jgi:AraC family transcriptional regulator of adaptative response/methylated-DNA-[protein]-cysteine methyltransferase
MKAMELLPPPDMMYRALLDRDSSFEGIFFRWSTDLPEYFAGPPVQRKKPARTNVDFFSTASEALP